MILVIRIEGLWRRELQTLKRAWKLDATFAGCNNSNLFLSVNKYFGVNVIDSLVGGHIGVVHKRFK